MSLSNDLISQFVKITKDETKTKQETIVYGKAIVDNGITKVQIDGSDTWTPVDTTVTIKSTDVNNGERVTVMIKDHSATIIGNTASPAARTVDVQDNEGKINHLVADNATINEKLTANTDDISTLKTDNVTTNQALTAANAAIDNLSTDKLDVNTANATYATIESLNAVNADVTNLIESTGKNKVLWSGDYYMTSEHTITLSEAVSSQVNGIVLVFSEYYDGASKNESFVCRFVPKIIVSSHSGSGHVFGMHTSDLAYFATKYLYISDTTITGHDNNNKSITGTCGITATTGRFVLRYVIGV